MLYIILVTTKTHKEQGERVQTFVVQENNETKYDSEKGEYRALLQRSLKR